MFGSKLKTWMENYIGRAKKKEAQKEKPKGNERSGVILESLESLAQSDTGLSSSSQQVLSSFTIDSREGYSTTTIDSEKSGMTQIHTAISLPSPESAYSTGYSTDGASSGATGPPEYYINIRTGKHYFPSPAPTPTSSQPENAISQLYSGSQRLPDNSILPLSLNQVSRVERELSSSSSSSSSAKVCAQASTRILNGFPSQVKYFLKETQGFALRQNTLSPPILDHSGMSSHSKSPNRKSSTKCQLTSLKILLKSPKNERERLCGDIDKTPGATENRRNQISSGKAKKWFKQPFHKFGHRKTDSSDERRLENDSKRGMQFDKNFSYLITQENASSPRQRNRIKTNPWLPTEPLSSQNFHNLSFSPVLARNRSCSNTPLQNRKISQPGSLQNRILQLNAKSENRRDHLDGPEKSANRSLGGNPVLESSDQSEEDLTLNEMMGTYNESYVYEKETDILSDSDPTDCEDYGTDSEANNGGDERDSHDDELDFIDNGSVIEGENNFSKNTGKCLYYDSHVKKNSFLFKTDRHHNKRSSECRRNSKKDHDPKSRREKRRQSRKYFRREDEEMQVKKTYEVKLDRKTEFGECVGCLDLSEVLVRRVMAGKESKSAEVTPVTGRRLKTTPLRESRIGNVKAEGIKPGISVKLNLGDAEADLKYKELIKEAENMLESMRNNPANKFQRKQKNFYNDKLETWQRTDCNATTASILKNTETTGSEERGKKEQETPNKNLRDSDLKFSAETPKKFKRLDFENKGQCSFRATSSTHSPLDPLGPTLRNFSIFNPASCEKGKTSTSSSEESENSLGEAHGIKGRERRWGAIAMSATPVVPVAFQSVDLGKPLTSYCPQSEPVKRKIYTCSETYDKLVKRFENKPTIFEENINGSISLETNARSRTDSSGLSTCLNGNQGSSPDKGEKGGSESSFWERVLPSSKQTPGDRSPSQIFQTFPSPKKDIFKRKNFISQNKKELT